MSSDMEPTIKRILEEEGIDFRERSRTIQGVACPGCGRSDKFSILKENGSCICYRGSCSFGRQWFDRWLSETANIPLREARGRLYGKREQSAESGFLTMAPPHKEKKTEDYILPMPWPDPTLMHLNDPKAGPGVSYLLSRGITLEVALAYQLMYSAEKRRVVLPVIQDGVCYGWQARAIDKDNPLRMLNNVGFRRDRLVMFADNIKGLSRVIITEGPFDALKFSKVGGFISTMGKGYSNFQIEFLKSRMPPGGHWFLAMDDDAWWEMSELARILAPDPVYRLYVPESCVKRCQKENKKPDFGECTPDECVESILNAQPVSTLDHLMNPWGV